MGKPFIPHGVDPKGWLESFGTTLKVVMDKQAESRGLTEALWNLYAEACRQHGVVPKVPDGRAVTNAGILRKT